MWQRCIRAANALDQNLWFAPALTAAFAAVLLTAALHHEMWRDELQVWLLARDSGGPLDMLHNMRYEGHPALWHLLVMPLTRITENPFAMQLLNWAFVTAAVYLIAKYAPFNPLHKILLAFGYYPLYQYGVIARSYGLGLLLITVVCFLWRRRYEKPFWLAAALFLLAHVSVHTCIIAIAAACGWLADFCLQRRAADWRKITAAMAVVVLGIVASIMQMNPPAGSSEYAGWQTQFHLEKLEHILRLAMAVILPGINEQFNLFGFDFRVAAAALEPYANWITAAAVATAITCYWRNPAVLITWGAASFGLLAFSYTKVIGGINQRGFLLAAALMLFWQANVWNTPPPPRKSEGMVRFCAGCLLTVMLAFHAYSGLQNIEREINTTYSNGKHAADYIRESELDTLPMLAFWDAGASTIYGYLGKRNVYHMLDDGRAPTYVRWDAKRWPLWSIADATQIVLQRAQQIAAKEAGKVLIIMSYDRPLSAAPEAPAALQYLQSFVGPATRGDEKYHLYLYELQRE